MANTFFITGTDTEVGKTFVTRALMQAGKEAGKQVLGYKPVASGCELINGELKNEDALALQAESSIKLPYAMHNSYAFAPAIAPHIAAEQAAEPIEPARITEGLARRLDFCGRRRRLALAAGAGPVFIRLGKKRAYSRYSGGGCAPGLH